jgi:hypothetical protein
MDKFCKNCGDVVVEGEKFCIKHHNATKSLYGFLLGLTLLFAISPVASAYTSTKGYYRSNGTYVNSHARSSPNAIKYDNYSYSSGSLYNKSYYSSGRNYSSSWYTPSYRTDSNYYYGKSLYNFNH